MTSPPGRQAPGRPDPTPVHDELLRITADVVFHLDVIRAAALRSGHARPDHGTNQLSLDLEEQ